VQPGSLLRSPLYLRVVASIALVLLIPTACTSLYSMQRSSAEQLEAGRQHLLQDTAAKATAVEARLLRSLSEVLQLNREPALLRYANALALEPGSPAEEVALLFQAFLRRSGGNYDGVAVLDRTGMERVSVTLGDKASQTQSRERLRSRADEPLFSGALSLTGIPGQQAPVYLAWYGSGLHYALPLSALDGSVAGVLVLSAPLTPLVEPLAPDEPGDRVYLVEASGGYLSDHEPERHPKGPGPGANLRAERPEDARELLGRQYGTLLDTAERPGVLQAFARIRPAGQGTIQWTVICERPLASVLAGVGESQRLLLAAAAGSLVLALLAALGLTRGIVEPIGLLAQAAAAISRGHWETRLPESTRGDEVGALTEAFAQMREQLQVAWQRQQRAKEELEQRVQERTQELREAQSRLMEAARSLGREEVSTTVLHNVGNVLLSVNVTAGLVEDQLRQSRVGLLRQATDMLQGHRPDLARFLTEDERGRLLPEYLARVSQVLGEERTRLLEDLQELRRNLEHANNIISVQQSMASPGVQILEDMDLSSVAEDALRIQLRPGLPIEVVRSYGPLPRVYMSRHKLLQVLVNLISNAKHALLASGREPKRLEVSIQASGEQVVVRVVDNGVGIRQEDMLRIFQYGFTAKKDGHGFGLHGSALHARAMGGSLRAHSDGPGQGATFTLELPVRSAPVEGSVALTGASAEPGGPPSSGGQVV
jgi:signal transduction histidine kinase